jgi:hypothetical protein
MQGTCRGCRYINYVDGEGNLCSRWNTYKPFLEGCREWLRD